MGVELQPPPDIHAAPVKEPGTKKKSGTKGSKSKAAALSCQQADKDSAKENTGRWTSEEHVLFLKGLEMHGKGWKKIAKLIKTRTVVQIRTHAQKYFQKLAKARKNGQCADLLLEGRFGKRFKYGRKRGLVYGSCLITQDGSTPSVSSLLRPFIASFKAEDALEKAVYRFLTPMVVDPSVTQLDASGVEVVQIPQDDLAVIKGDQAVGESLPVLAKITTDLYVRCTVPDWFKKGGDLEDLFKEAAALDWLSDDGGDSRNGGGVGLPMMMNSLVRRMGIKPPLDGSDDGTDTTASPCASLSPAGPLFIVPPQLPGHSLSRAEQSPTTSSSSATDDTIDFQNDLLASDKLMDFSDLQLNQEPTFGGGFSLGMHEEYHFFLDDCELMDDSEALTF